MADQGQTKQENDAPPDSGALLSLCWASIFGLGLVLLFVVLVLMLIAIWPTVQSNPSKFLGRAWAPDVSLFGWRIIPELTSEIRLILIVVAAAGLGSFLHAASSFADYLGNRRLNINWLWWIYLRVPIGIGLALLFYMLIRGGMLSLNTPDEGVSAYGIAAMSGLVGMFSLKATDKLRELFDTLFKTPDERKDKLVPPKPEIGSIEPAQLAIGTATPTITVRGDGFVSGSKVRVGNTERETKYNSEHELVATLMAADVASAGTLSITVLNPTNGAVSEAKTVSVQ